MASEAVATSDIKAAGYGIDAWDEPSTLDLVSRVMDDFGSIDILFGIARRPWLQDRSELPTSEWQSQFDKGFLRFRAATEVLLSGMRDRQSDRILWMIPWTKRGAGVERRVHCVTAAALSSWLRSLAAEVVEDGITLNILKSTPVARNPVKNLRSRKDQPRPGFMLAPGYNAPSVSQVASVATFLLSDIAGGVCGKTIKLGSRRHNSG